MSIRDTQIPAGLKANIMRKSMENKNTLKNKGSIYVGTGISETIESTNIYETIELQKGAANTVLRVKPDGSNIEYDFIGTDNISINAVTTEKIVDGAVTTDKILNGNITSSKIKLETIVASNIADNTITTKKMAASGANVDKVLTIKDMTGGVYSAMWDQVSTNGLADNAVISSKILNGSINEDKIAANAVTSGKILNGSINEDKIAANAVTSGKIANDAVTGPSILDKTITSDKIFAAASYVDKVLTVVNDGAGSYSAVWDICPKVQTTPLTNDNVIHLSGAGSLLSKTFTGDYYYFYMTNSIDSKIWSLGILNVKHIKQVGFTQVFEFSYKIATTSIKHYYVQATGNSSGYITFMLFEQGHGTGNPTSWGFYELYFQRMA